MEALQAILLVVCLLAPVAASQPFDDDEAWRLVQYRGPIAQEERAFLASLADPILDPAPPFGYYARLSAHDEAILASRPAVLDVREVDLTAKASRDLDATTRHVRVLAFPDTDLASFAAHLLREGAASARAPPSSFPILDVELGALGLDHLLRHEGTRWVEPSQSEAFLDNEGASAILQGGTDDAWPVHAQGIDGSTQLVAYCDTGLDTDAGHEIAVDTRRERATLPIGHTVHEQFAHPGETLVHNLPAWSHRKVALYYSPIDAKGLRGDFDDPDAHGTHVAGTLAGDAGVWGVRDGHDGVAFAAKLVVCDVGDPSGFHVLADYSGYWQPAYDAGARIHSNSWGTPGTGEYTLVARQHDAYVWEHRDFLLLRSMGNNVEGVDGTMRREAAAKNVLAIGATMNEPGGVMWGPSIHGPAIDGRIKPDLVAPGACVTSAWPTSPTSYRCLNGTSTSTPVVAGAAALVRDYFEKGFYPSGSANGSDARAPSAALVRAVLAASAAPVASAAPDGAEGWGLPQLERALFFDGDAGALLVHDEATALETGEAWSTTLDVAASGPLRVVLAWTDHPAAPGASPALVNDLDLELILPNGTILRGNVDLVAPDRTNVIERALLTNATAGTYTLRVRGWNVPMGPQPFALVAVQE